MARYCLFSPFPHFSLYSQFFSFGGDGGDLTSILSLFALEPSPPLNNTRLALSHYYTSCVLVCVSSASCSFSTSD